MKKLSINELAVLATVMSGLPTHVIRQTDPQLMGRELTRYDAEALAEAVAKRERKALRKKAQRK